MQFKIRALIVVLVAFAVVTTSAFASGIVAFPHFGSETDQSKTSQEQTNQNLSSQDQSGEQSGSRNASASSQSADKKSKNAQRKSEASANNSTKQGAASSVKTSEVVNALLKTGNFNKTEVASNKTTTQPVSNNTTNNNPNNPFPFTPNPAPKPTPNPTPVPNPEPEQKPTPTPNPDKPSKPSPDPSKPSEPEEKPKPEPDNPPVLQAYNVTFSLNAQGAAWNNEEAKQRSTQTAKAKDTISLPKAKDMKRLGWVLIGWNTDKNQSSKGQAVYAPGQNFTMPSKNTVLYAVWEQAEYTVSFSGEAISGIPDKTGVHWVDFNLLPVVNPVRANYEFVGWFTQVNGAGIKVDEQTTYADLAQGNDAKTHVTLYAYWKAKETPKPDPDPEKPDPDPEKPDPSPEDPTPVKQTFNLTYDLQDGETSTKLPATYTQGDDAITLPDNITKTGYEFMGWSTKAKSEPKKRFVIPTTLDSDLKLTANWKPITYKLVCSLEGGQLPTGTSIPSSYTIESSAITLPIPIKEHYVFEGWQEKGSTKKALNVTILAGSVGDKTYAATWSPEIHSLTLRLGAADAFWVGEGTSKASEKTLTSPFNKPVVLPANSEVRRIGYALEGWSVPNDNTHTTIHEPGKAYSIPEKNSVLRAVWKERTYAVAYDAAGGVLKGGAAIPSKTDVRWSSANLLPGETPVKEGFEFVGWFAKPDSEETRVTDETTYATLAGGDDAKTSITLYAHWDKAEVPIDDKTIKFNTAKIKGTDLYTMDDAGAVQLVQNPDISHIQEQPARYLAHVKQEGQSDIWAPVESVQNVNGTNYLKLSVSNYYDNSLKQEGLYVQPGNKAQAQTEFSQAEGYDAANATAYANLRQFMPYYDVQQVVNEGNKLVRKHPDNLLCTKKAIGIFPVNEQGERLIALAADDASDVAKIQGLRVQFDNDDATTETYPLEYVDTRSDVASYRVKNLDVHFNFPKLVVNKSASFNKVLSAANDMDHDSDLQPTYRQPNTDNNDNKNIRKRNFNESVKPRMEEVMVAYAASFSEELPVNSDNAIAQAVVNSWLSDSDALKLKRFLCMYNYLDRWCGFVIGGINMRDVVMFDSSVLPGATNTKNLIITKNCDESGASGRSGGSTQEYYNAFLKGPMGKNSVAQFVEYFMRYYAQEKDVNDWIVKNFKHGYIAEAKCENSQIHRRVWSLIKRNSELKNQQMVLPVLSYDTGNGLYMIGLSVGLLWGDLQIYKDYDSKNPQRIGNEIKRRADEYNHMLDNFAAFSSRATTRLKQQINLITDQTQTFGKTEMKEVGPGIYIPITISAGEQFRNNDAIKEVILPLGKYRGHQRAGALTAISGIADRDFIYFCNGSLRQDFSTFEHEMGHLLTIAMCDNRNPRLGNEAINDGYANEAELDLNMNFKKTFSRDSAALSNLSPERIMTEEKYKSHFKGEFDNLYLIDHLQAEGYLQLNSSQKSAITSKHSYADSHKTSVWYKSANGNTPVFWNASEIEAMNLESFTDLYDQGIAVRAGCQDHQTGHALTLIKIPIILARLPIPVGSSPITLMGHLIPRPISATVSCLAAMAVLRKEPLNTLPTK